jgi:threonyl-tRNA synthetase
VRVLPISDGQLDAARRVAETLTQAGLRVHLDDRHDTLNYRVRDGELMKVPYLAVVGQREADNGTVAVRARGAGKKQEVLPVADLVERLKQEVTTRSLTSLV